MPKRKRTKSQNEEIIDLYLEGWTEAEIGRKLKVAIGTVSTALSNFRNSIDAEIEIPDPPQIGDVWLFTNYDDAYGISGFPGDRLEWLKRAEDFVNEINSQREKQTSLF